MIMVVLFVGALLGGDDAENAKIRAKAKSIQWDELLDLNYQTGKRPKKLNTKLAGPVKISGYALPLEADGKGISTFVLVSDPMFCAHVPPPPPNQLILVELGRSLPWKVFDRSVILTGTMEIVDQKSEFGGYMYKFKKLAGLEKGGW